MRLWVKETKITYTVSIGSGIYSRVEDKERNKQVGIEDEIRHKQEIKNAKIRQTYGPDKENQSREWELGK